MEGRAWWAAVHGVPGGWTRLRAFTFTFHFHALEKEVATHFSILAWRIPGTAEPGGLLSTGSHRVRHDWSNLAAAAARITFFPSPAPFPLTHNTLVSHSLNLIVLTLLKADDLV